MPRLRIQLELNPGGDGIRLDKLANISGELEKFLRHLAKDCGVHAEPGEWIARQFYNSSVGAVLEHVRSVEPPAVARFNEGVKFFSAFRQERDRFTGAYSENTIRHFVDIGSKLDPDEVVRIGLYNDEDDPVPLEWEKIAKRTTLEVEEAALRPVIFYGSVQGRLGTWFKDSDFIYVRDAVTGNAVKCHYKPAKYDLIYRYYKERSGIVHVSGRVSSDRLTGHPKEIDVDSIDHYERLSDAEFLTVFGSAPELTGTDSTEEFIDRIREDGGT